MDKKEERYRDAWPPPNCDIAPVVRARDILLEQTKQCLLSMHPQYKDAIEREPVDSLVLNFAEMEGGERSLCIVHGLVVTIDGENSVLYVRDEDSEKMLNGLAPEQSLEFARDLVWTYVIDILDQRRDDNEEPEDDWEDSLDDEDEETDEDEDVDFSDMVPELQAWNEGGYEEEDEQDQGRYDESDGRELRWLDGMDDSDFVRVANENRELRKLYFDVLHGRLSNAD